MPITGASGLLDIKSVLADAKAELAKATAEFKTGLAAELSGLAADVRENGALVIKKVRAERQEARSQFDELLGNEHAAQVDDVAGKPPPSGEADAASVTAASQSETVIVATDQVGTLPPNLLGGSS